MTHRRHLHQVAPTTLDDLAGHVPQTYIDGARAVSSAFQKAGVAHVLVGGLAVGVCGYPRPTKDIDFLVDDSAFEFHGPIVSHRPGLPVSYQGVSVDWVSLEPHERAALEKFLVLPLRDEDVPVLPVEPLVAMKLIAGRLKDQTDVVEIVKAGADIASIRNFVAKNFPTKTKLLDKLIDLAMSEGD